MNTGLVNRETNEIVQFEPLTAKQVKAQVQLIQEVMEAVMDEGVHYGNIPGCGSKAALFKAGAEKLASTFKLALEPEIKEMNDGDSISFLITTKVLTPSGNFLGSGVGFASTKEEKYNWRKVVNEDEYNATPEDRRRLKYCVDYKTNKNYTIQQIRTNPYDIANTVLKMADKRSNVAAILKVTAASDIFTQDSEDNPEQYEKEEKKWAPSKAQIDRFWAITNKHGFTDEKVVREILLKTCETEHLHELTKEQYERLCGDEINKDETKRRNSYFKELVIARGEKAAKELHG